MQYFVFCKTDLVLEKTAEGYAIPNEAPAETRPWTTVMDIDGAKAYRIEHPITGSERFEMCPLRQSYYKLSEKDYLHAGKCHELLYWDQNSKFCGCCGGPMRFDTPISKKCEHCGKELWPQLATAIIVLIRRPAPAAAAVTAASASATSVTTASATATTTTASATTASATATATTASASTTTASATAASASTTSAAQSPVRRGCASASSEVLLVHARNFHGDHYGLVAGFVETGETLEEAVHREVLEEVGLHIKNLKYFGSQPWPYPCGLMVGFTADYDYGEIHLQRSELSKGSWFDRDHLPHIPEKLSIARRLIDTWLEETKQQTATSGETKQQTATSGEAKQQIVTSGETKQQAATSDKL